MSELPIDKSKEERTFVLKADKVNLRKLHLNSLTADPSDVADGDIWYRSDSHAFKGRNNGVTYTFTIS